MRAQSGAARARLCHRAYAATRSDKVGEAAKATGGAAVAVGGKVVDINKEHKVTDKIGDGLKKAGSALQSFDSKHDVSGAFLYAPMGELAVVSPHHYGCTRGWWSLVHCGCCSEQLMGCAERTDFGRRSVTASSGSPSGAMARTHTSYTKAQQTFRSGHYSNWVETMLWAA